MRQLKAVDGGEARWVIADEELGHISVPQSWTRPVGESESWLEDPQAIERERKVKGQVNMLVLLKLANLVEDLRKKQSHPGESHVNEAAVNRAAPNQPERNSAEQSRTKAAPKGESCGRGVGEAAGGAAEATGPSTSENGESGSGSARGRGGEG